MVEKSVALHWTETATTLWNHERQQDWSTCQSRASGFCKIYLAILAKVKITSPGTEEGSSLLQRKLDFKDKQLLPKAVYY